MMYKMWKENAEKLTIRNKLGNYKEKILHIESFSISHLLIASTSTIDSLIFIFEFQVIQFSPNSELIYTSYISLLIV